METGISAASLYPLETEKALVRLSALGFSLFEIFCNSFYEFSPEYCAQLNALQQAHGFRIRSVHPFTSALESMLLFERYERRTQEGLELYRRYMEAAASIGASIVVLHGQRLHTGSLSDAEYFERYAMLYEIGQHFGVTVAQENVFLFRSSSSAFIRDMRRTLSTRCAFVLDTKQAALSGEDLCSMCSAMGEQLVHVHLSDRTAAHTCLLPGEGSCDFHALRNCLNALHYEGAVITEVYRNAIQSDEALVRARIFTETLFSE